MTLNAEVLRCDADVQPRLALSEAHIREYAALLQEGHQLGTIVVFQDGSASYLADGFHRVAAAKSIGLEELPAELRAGSKRDAMLYACGANKHGKPLSNRDKQRVVLHLLEDAEWRQWSDREIARHCGVGHAFVSRLRRSLSTGDSDTTPHIYRARQGTVTAMDTRAIGKRATPDVLGVASTQRGSHSPEGATNTTEMAAGNPVRETVNQARQGPDIGLLPPPFAEAICEVAGNHERNARSDDFTYVGYIKEAEVARAALPKRLSQLFDLLEALVTVSDLEQCLLDISPDWYDRVDHDLDTAFETLRRLRTLWKKHRHADVSHLQDTHTQTSPVPEGSAEQQLSQPAHASRERETGPAQPRDESEDPTKQTEKTGADYDTARFYLGKLCPRAHTYRDTGKTLRRMRKGDCVQCHREP